MMEKKMETTVVYWGNIGIMEKKMESILYWRSNVVSYTIRYQSLYYLMLLLDATMTPPALPWPARAPGFSTNLQYVCVWGVHHF